MLRAGKPARRTRSTFLAGKWPVVRPRTHPAPVSPSPLAGRFLLEFTERLSCHARRVMKEIIPPPPIVHNEQQQIQELFNKFVVPSYGRFDLAFKRGQGSYLWDVRGQRYLDLGGGIAVCALGHANPEITEALIAQSRELVHVSNLYHHAPQGLLAKKIVEHLAPGKVFFCNSGAEANEGLYKLARKFGHDEGRFEIITTINSFHGRTLGGIAATGQDKIKKGFEPIMPGFRHVPYNDLQAVEAAISPATVAVLIEGIQGEGGITPATPDYLLGLRKLCDERKLLLMIDAVQCGHFRSGRFQSFQRILETGRSRGDEALTPPDHASRITHHASQSLLTSAPTSVEFLPDAVSMAKSLGGGFPIGAFWAREPHGDLLGPGTHGTTFGGTPLGCAVALKVFEVIERDRLAENVRQLGDWLKAELLKLQAEHPSVLSAVRGLGFMIGIELAEKIPAFTNSDKVPAIQMVNRLHAAGLMTIPSGSRVFRLLPPLNLTRNEAAEGLAIIRAEVKKLA
jgi:acetylornithine/N-succinyldiaminopimelate aminotransferase